MIAAQVLESHTKKSQILQKICEIHLHFPVDYDIITV